MNATLQKHAKKAGLIGGTGSLGGIMAWALMTFTPISQHDQTRREIQSLREAVAPIRYDYEHERLPCSCGRTNQP